MLALSRPHLQRRRTSAGLISRSRRSTSPSSLQRSVAQHSAVSLACQLKTFHNFKQCDCSQRCSPVSSCNTLISHHANPKAEEKGMTVQQLAAHSLCLELGIVQGTCCALPPTHTHPHTPHHTRAHTRCSRFPTNTLTASSGSCTPGSCCPHPPTPSPPSQVAKQLPKHTLTAS